MLKKPAFLFEKKKSYSDLFAFSGSMFLRVNLKCNHVSPLHSMLCFADEVSSIGFHQDRHLIAFGSASGCVHLFSLC